jgi:hypothetical protein
MRRLLLAATLFTAGCAAPGPDERDESCINWALIADISVVVARAASAAVHAGSLTKEAVYETILEVLFTALSGDQVCSSAPALFEASFEDSSNAMPTSYLTRS